MEKTVKFLPILYRKFVIIVWAMYLKHDLQLEKYIFIKIITFANRGILSVYYYKDFKLHETRKRVTVSN